MTPPRAEAVPERLEEEHLGLGPGEPRRAEPERMGAEGLRGFGRHPRLQTRHDAGGLPGDLLRDDGRDERAGRRLGPEPRGGGPWRRLSSAMIGSASRGRLGAR